GPHTGHAEGPCPSSTRSATTICCGLVARSAREAYFVPPNASQVLCWNWRPPKEPLPVLVSQFPVLSQAATFSQVSTAAAFAVLAPANGRARPAPPAVTVRDARETRLG